MGIIDVEESGWDSVKVVVAIWAYDCKTIRREGVRDGDVVGIENWSSDDP